MLHFLQTRFEEVLSATLLAIMVSIAFLNVIVRYCTSFSFAWTEELTVNFFVWIVLIGTARAFRDNSHLGMSLLYSALPRPWRRICLFISAAFTIIFFGILVRMGIAEVIDEYELESISESLGIPVWWYTIATPVFSCLIIVRAIQRLCMDLRSEQY
ncbi:MAG: TRAP transporter small permease [Desulfovibrionaceae bacterium]|nr:TRAP transporter small permease [Desulfovibrionaceae bacterium]